MKNILTIKELQQQVKAINEKADFSNDKGRSPLFFYSPSISCNVKIDDVVDSRQVNLTTNNIEKLNSSALNVKNPAEILKTIKINGKLLKADDDSEKIISAILKNHNYITSLEFKDHLIIAEMSEMIVLKKGINKTSILTFNIHPCVAVIATNLTDGTVGLAHIPGTTFETMCSKEEDLKYQDFTFEKMNYNSLSRGLQDFLQTVKGEQDAKDVNINLIGGCNDRYLLLTICKLIDKMGYILDAKNIHHGRSGSIVNAKFELQNTDTFDIEVDKNGEIFLLKDASTLFDEDVDLMHKILNWNSQDEAMKHIFEVYVGTNNINYRKFDQFDYLTLKTFGPEGNSVNTYYPYATQFTGDNQEGSWECYT